MPATNEYMIQIKKKRIELEFLEMENIFNQKTVLPKKSEVRIGEAGIYQRCNKIKL